MKKKLFFAGAVFMHTILNAASSKAQTKVFTVKANEIKAEIQPTMWGIFFEDINMGADGGIYAELVKNRSFEFYSPLMGWKVSGKDVKEGDVLVLNRKEVNTANPRYVQITLNNAGKNSIAITNEGFRGMGIKKGLRYDFSVMYRQQSANVKMHLELINLKGEIIGTGLLSPNETGSGWHKQGVSFNATETEQKAKLNIWFEGNGRIDLDMISLFPEDTWKKRPGGMRADMIQLLADMKPGFIRFPGGCIVEGRDLANRYQWKNTIGPIEKRQLIMNRWNTEFDDKLTPDYFQTFGLGFFEYFQLAEDIGAQALPILNAGMACQFNSAEVVALDELDPYVQDALDLIEFANGSTTSKWGKVRAEMGHPKPFNLKMMGVGNENWGPQYLERLQVFTKAIKAKYPDFKLINSSGTDPIGKRFDYLNTALRKMNVDFIDEHYYRKPEWFMENASRYDNYPRNGPKIFAGEYAAHSDKSGSEKNNWSSALAEAAFMTGLERNADVVSMASYAPLFAHIDAWQWSPDLIWVDNLRSYGTTDYQVQKLFSLNKGTQEVPILMDDKAIAGKDGFYACAALDKATNEIILKVVNTSAKAQQADFVIVGTKVKSYGNSSQCLSSDDLDKTNSFTNPTAVSPIMEELPPIIKNKLHVKLDAYSVNVIRIKKA